MEWRIDGDVPRVCARVVYTRRHRRVVVTLRPAAAHSRGIRASPPRVHTMSRSSTRRRRRRRRPHRRPVVRAFFNTLFVSLGLASPVQLSILLATLNACSYGRVLSDPWRSRRRASTIGTPNRCFALRGSPLEEPAVLHRTRRSVHKHTCRHADDTSCRYIRRLTVGRTVILVQQCSTGFVLARCLVTRGFARVVRIGQKEESKFLENPSPFPEILRYSGASTTMRTIGV